MDEASSSLDDLPKLDSLGTLATVVTRRPRMFVRCSKGPASDATEQSRDHATGLDLPGLAVNPLDPPRWWRLPLEISLARQIRAYAHLSDDQPDHLAWVLTGTVVDRGPDNEPLVVDVEPIARLASDDYLEESDPESVPSGETVLADRRDAAREHVADRPATRAEEEGSDELELDPDVAASYNDPDRTRRTGGGRGPHTVVRLVAR